MRIDNRVLYFSLNPKSVKSFYDCLNNTCLDSQCSFRIIDKGLVFDEGKDGTDKGLVFDEGKDGTSKFKHASDLLYFLNEYGKNEDLGYLYVIVDYPSFFNPPKHLELKKTNEIESFSVKDAAKIMRRAILQYPEVFFMFDESWNTNDDPWFPKFLFDFNDKEYNGSNVVAKYHAYSIKKKDPFKSILRGRSSMFDGSNLRYAIKRYEYDVLNVERYNFSLLQSTRADSLAICIEEERSQNRFNSYLLYANGYRVLPVSSSKELMEVNENKDELDPKLIVRDYDLQFPDVDDKKESIEKSEKELYIIHTIDRIRGAKYIKKGDNTRAKQHSGEDQVEDVKSTYLNKWLVPQDDNPYWDKLLQSKEKKAKVLFVSKGIGEKIHFCSTYNEFIRGRSREMKMLDCNKDSKANKSDLFIDGVSHQVVMGTTKPISGIYTTFRQFKTIKEQYDSFKIGSKRQFQKTHTKEKEEELNKAKDDAIQATKEVKKLKELAENKTKDINDAIEKESEVTKQVKRIEKIQDWYIDTNRKNHEHGVPLDIYDTVKNMLERAWRYYNDGKYIRSAIISSEIIEILNGFHEALVLQAYHILAISENAIAMSTIGANEKELSIDANFRISKIASDVGRLMDRDGEDRRRFKYNFLYQIYSDCRIFCKEKGHLEAENRFISVMAHVNEGYTYSDIFREIIHFLNKSWVTICNYMHTLFYDEKN